MCFYFLKAARGAKLYLHCDDLAIGHNAVFHVKDCNLEIKYVLKAEYCRFFKQTFICALKATNVRLFTRLELQVR